MVIISRAIAKKITRPWANLCQASVSIAFGLFLQDV
jgi:hypothetical protein